MFGFESMTLLPFTIRERQMNCLLIYKENTPYMCFMHVVN